jgi:uncharacterized protein (DUF736 family)
MENKFETKPNSGALFSVKSKTNANQPDYRGDVLIDLSTFKQENGKIMVALSGWKKTSKNGNVFLSLQAQKPYVKEEEQERRAPQNNPIDDDDIPF